MFTHGNIAGMITYQTKFLQHEISPTHMDQNHVDGEIVATFYLNL